MRNLWFIQRFFICLMASFTVLGVGAVMVWTAQHSLAGLVAEVFILVSAVGAMKGGRNARGK